MKNRRKIVVALLVCACLVLSVGYAALADELVIDGNGSYEASLSPFDADVYFTQVIAQGNGVTATVTAGSDSATFDIKLNSADSSTYESKSGSVYTSEAVYEFTYVVDNAEENTATSATFSAPVLTVAPGAGWTVEAVICDHAGTPYIGNQVTLEDGETACVKITVSYDSSVDDGSSGAVTTGFTVNVPVSGT